MTQMKHKSADAKRTRRNRYKDAVKPVIARFGCTSTQVADKVRETFADNERLQRKVEEQSREIARLKDQLRETLKKK